MNNYIPACIVAAVVMLLAGCTSIMPNGKPYDGVDPISGQSVSLKAIEKCYARGGVKNYNVVDDKATCAN